MLNLMEKQTYLRDSVDLFPKSSLVLQSLFTEELYISEESLMALKPQDFSFSMHSDFLSEQLAL